MRTVSSLVELVGMLLVVAGLGLFDWRLALIAGGLVVVLVGMAVDRPTS